MLLRWFYLTAMVTSLSFSLAVGGTVRVPSEQPTIQAGIDAAIGGDTVLVAAGVYSGEGNYDLNFFGRAIILLSETGAHETTIDCAGLGRAFSLSGTFGYDPSIIGFTIANGDGGNQGGGIECFAYSPAIRNCVFLNNQANYGGAIYFNGAIGTKSDESSGSSPLLQNCTFIGNVAHVSGSVTHLNYGAEPRFYNCLLCGNSSPGEGPPIVFGQGGGGALLRCSDIYGNLPGDWIGSISAQLAILDNMSEPPVFCDETSDDYRLRPNSPCAPANNDCETLIGALEANCGPCADADGDEFCDWFDNCSETVNPDQSDWDGNGIGDACDDSDSDGVVDADDNCITVGNPLQEDVDHDGIGELCDNCPRMYNPGQEDEDENGTGDICEGDPDEDGWPSTVDNCPLEYNPDQVDSDGDWYGDACDPCPNMTPDVDADGDCVADGEDSCPGFYNPIQGCCCNRVGDANGGGGDEPTIGDVSRIIDVLFICGLDCDFDCVEEADINRSGGPYPTRADVTISDISMLIDYMFIAGPDNMELPTCYQEAEDPI